VLSDQSHKRAATWEGSDSGIGMKAAVWCRRTNDVSCSILCRPDPIDLVRRTEERDMLVLSRKLGQSFHLGPDVRVTIVKIDRNSVRIGIEAPGEVPIQREEIVFELPESFSLKTSAA
jgi:carbon storage regulator